jgi:Polyketide cyclase / dehydrase and lipid transport
MATIKREVALSMDADRAWQRVGDFGNAAQVFAGALRACERSGDLRTVTFANGLKIQERLVSRDQHDRRFVYAVLDGPFTHHSASMQILADDNGCKFVWISDFLPDEVAPGILPLIEDGCRSLQRNLAAD